MRLQINGEERVFSAAELSVKALLLELGFAADQVVVELNGTVIDSKTDAQVLRDGDVMEVVRFMGGG